MITNTSTSTYTSYTDLLNLRNEFRKAGGTSDCPFNSTDTPSHKYFKVFFHFVNGDDSDGTDILSSSGLLTPTWLVANGGQYVTTTNETDEEGNVLSSTSTLDNDIESKYVVSEDEVYESAWAYLMNNGETDRAKNLRMFVQLLSNISSYSPWYFQTIEGLDSAIERTIVNDKEFKLSEERRKLTFKCLKDAIDDRIGTLLDLYRSVVYSHSMKRWILPANLRKFDMSILVFEQPITTLHQGTSEESAAYVGQGSGKYRASYKYYEFHNCEIEYNSSKSSSTLDDTTGWDPEYSIEIAYDDMYEDRYNAFMSQEIGDFVVLDYDNNISNLSIDYESSQSELTSRLDYYDNKGFLQTAIDEVAGTVGSVVSNKITSAVLGNLYTLSLTKATSQVQAALSGDILGTASAAYNYAQNANISNRSQYEWSKSFSNGKIINTLTMKDAGDLGSLWATDGSKVTEEVKDLGNIFMKQSIANNI